MRAVAKTDLGKSMLLHACNAHCAGATQAVHCKPILRLSRCPAAGPQSPPQCCACRDHLPLGPSTKPLTPSHHCWVARSLAAPCKTPCSTHGGRLLEALQERASLLTDCSCRKQIGWRACVLHRPAEATARLPSHQCYSPNQAQASTSEDLIGRSESQAPGTQPACEVIVSRCEAKTLGTPPASAATGALLPQQVPIHTKIN